LQADERFQTISQQPGSRLAENTAECIRSLCP
jgi:hypothetical protein